MMKTSLDRRQVLIVDDDLALNEMLSELLAREGYDTRSAFDGLQAVEAIRERAPDLIVLDINMPRLNGWDVLWDIRNSSETAFLPVIMLTVEKDGESMTRGWSEGVDCYLGKPFDVDELLLMVQRLIRVNEEQTIPGIDRSLL